MSATQTSAHKHIELLYQVVSNIRQCFIVAKKANALIKIKALEVKKVICVCIHHIYFLICHDKASFRRFL